eukprot:GHVU01182248.1.p1 GENE.GHVU01182248.1~~GHVU01182248.1.p1  ORF type:complete len:192 (-),score=26.56 GHVU01182248.1:310-885(-)
MIPVVNQSQAPSEASSSCEVPLRPLLSLTVSLFRLQFHSLLEQQQPPLLDRLLWSLWFHSTTTCVVVRLLEVILSRAEALKPQVLREAEAGGGPLSHGGGGGGERHSATGGAGEACASQQLLKKISGGGSGVCLSPMGSFPRRHELRRDSRVSAAPLFQLRASINIPASSSASTSGETAATESTVTVTPTG